MITITSKYDGFIRCGIRHPSEPTFYPDSRFTAEQLEILTREPALSVVITRDATTADAPDKPRTGAKKARSA